MYIELEIEKIETNPYQPRTVWDQAKLEEISTSIKQIGIMQPLVVREHNGTYQLIAGERRYRGAKMAGLSKVPVIVRQATDEEMLKLAMIENLHREDMSPIDRAAGFRDLMSQFSMTQKQIAEIFNLSRPAIANTLRLLDLEDEIKDALHSKKITEGHARALLSLRNTTDRLSFFKRMVNNNLSVRESEELSKRIRKLSRERSIELNKQRNSIHESRLIEELRLKLGTRVNMIQDGGVGRIEIEYYSEEDLDRITEVLLSPENSTKDNV